MIRATELNGRAVVDMDVAEKLGRIDKVVLDPDSRRVAGFVLSQGASLFNSGTPSMLSAACVHAIGPDAVTVRRGEAGIGDDAQLDGLPRVSDMVGRKVVSQEGRFLGSVNDVLIDEVDGRIIGYALTDDASRSLSSIVSDDKKDRRPPYLRADADLRAGNDLIVAPESAVSYDWTSFDSASMPRPGADAPATRWTLPAAPAAASNPWVRRDAATREPGVVKTGGPATPRSRTAG